MPLLILLGIIVVVIAAVIFKVNKIQSDRYIEMAKRLRWPRTPTIRRTVTMKINR